MSTSTSVSSLWPESGLSYSSQAWSLVSESLRRLIERVESPRALVFRPADRARIHGGAQRVSAQLGGLADCVLTIALAGGSGVGKSTLINALAGSAIAEAAEQRPCTMQPTIYHHHDVPVGGLPAELASDARNIVHDRPELRFKVVVDTPDLDSFATQNRMATRALLKAAGMVLYVFTPEKYWEERVWSVIREEERFSACIAVLNKADTVPIDALERASEEIRRRFAEMGKPEIAVLRVAAVRHIPASDGRLPSYSATTLDEFATLRAYIEHELHEGDIARMRREQRLRAIENLQDVIEHAVPPDLPTKLDRLTNLANEMAEWASSRLSLALADRFQSLDAEMRPLVAVRRHQLFVGPFRLWLAIGDFLSFGLPRLVRRLRTMGVASEFDASLSSGQHDSIEHIDLNCSGRLRDMIFQAGLPVDRWRVIAEHSPASDLVKDLAVNVQERFEAVAAASPSRVRWVARISSAIATMIPVGLAAYALWALISSMGSGRVSGGLGMLGLVFALTILAYVVLHSLTAIALIGTQPAPIHEIGRQAAMAVLQRRFGGWVAVYRADLDADLVDLRAPLEHLLAIARAPIGPASYLPSSSASALSKLAPVDSNLLSVEGPVAQAAAISPDSPAEFEMRTVARAPESAVSAQPENAAEAGQDVRERQPIRPADLFRQAVQRHASKTPKG